MASIVWRPFRVISRENPGVIFMSTPFLPHGSGLLLLRQIVRMPKEGLRKIGYDEACLAFLQAYHDRPQPSLDVIGTKVGWREAQMEAKRFRNQFIDWLTAQGYYIALQGDEFMPTTGVQ